MTTLFYALRWTGRAKRSTRRRVDLQLPEQRDLSFDWWRSGDGGSRERSELRPAHDADARAVCRWTDPPCVCDCSAGVCRAAETGAFMAASGGSTYVYAILAAHSFLGSCAPSGCYVLLSTGEPRRLHRGSDNAVSLSLNGLRRCYYCRC